MTIITEQERAVRRTARIIATLFVSKLPADELDGIAIELASIGMQISAEPHVHVTKQVVLGTLDAINQLPR